MTCDTVIHALLMSTLLVKQTPDNRHLIRVSRHFRQVFRKPYAGHIRFDGRELAPNL